MAIPTAVIPPLESGDRLTREEFHRLYDMHPEIKRAELVEGVVYVSSPLSITHGEPHGLVLTWLGVYRSKHPELRLGDNVTVILDDANEVQPDAFLLREEIDGPHVNEKGYILGGPQFIFEIAASSASYDLHDKLAAYQRNGVPEYVVLSVRDGIIDWFRLRDGQYQRVSPEEGRIESSVFPGLWLNLPRMVNGDLAGVLRELEPA